MAAGALCPMTASASAAQAAGPAPATSAACPLPVVSDVYDGFRVGVPAGWDVSALDGQVGVSANAAGTEGVLLYPAFLNSGLTAQGLFSAVLGYEQKLLAKEGESLRYSEHSGPLPTARLQITRGSTVLAGQATVMDLPLRTAVASRLGVFAAYWAPKAHFGADASTLAAVAHCYQPERAALFQLFRDIGPFTFAMPAGWRVSSIGQDYLQLSGFGNGAGVDYELWGPFEQGVNATQSITSAVSAISYLFHLYHIKVTQVLSGYVLPNQQGPTGVQSTAYVEFAGLLNGKPTHGLVNMVANISGNSAAGVIRLGLASPSLWNSVEGALVEMMGSVQHNFSGDLQQIAHLNQQWQMFSGQVANFDDALNSQQLAQDPTNGKLYEAPYAAWDPNGAGGPGYYLPNGQKLNPVERP